MSFGMLSRIHTISLELPTTQLKISSSKCLLLCHRFMSHGRSTTTIGASLWLGSQMSISTMSRQSVWNNWGAVSAEKTLALLSRRPPFLPRCRALEHLEIGSLGPNMFHLAANWNSNGKCNIGNTFHSNPTPVVQAGLHRLTPTVPFWIQRIEHHTS
jgi:hypothetical protein